MTMPPEASISRVPSGTARSRPDLGDAVAGDEDVRAGQHPVGGVDRQHGAAPQDDRP